MECPTEQVLLDYVDGRVATPARAPLLQHVDGCESCQSAVSEITQTLSVAWGAAPAAAPLATDLVGTTIGGEWVIDDVLGSGGMGVVYRAHHAILEKRVAVKTLRPELATDDAEMGKLVKEGKAVSSVSHAGIVDVFSMGKLPDGRHYLVMELLAGEPLNQLIRREAPLPPARAISILLGVCEALAAVHAAGFVHRDLKPSNLFLVPARDGKSPLTVKLLDFGLARRDLEGPASHAPQVLGTPAYMPPEQAQGKLGDARSDLYSLGVIAYELLTGVRPFRASTVRGMLEAQVSSPPPRPRGLPGPLEALVFSLLAKDPARRPASCADARTGLERALRRRGPGSLAIASVATLLAGALALGAVVTRPARPPPPPVAPAPQSPSPPEPIVAAPLAPPAPAPEPVVKRAGPSLDARRDRLGKRLTALEATIKTQSGSAVALSFLAAYRDDLGRVRTDAALAALTKSVDDFERKYVKR